MQKAQGGFRRPGQSRRVVVSVDHTYLAKRKADEVNAPGSSSRERPLVKPFVISTESTGSDQLSSNRNGELS